MNERVKDFLDKLLEEKSPDSVYSNKRTSAFWEVLERTLTPVEEQVMYNLLHGLTTLERLPAKEKFLYELACAKLRGDILEVNALRTSARGDMFLESDPTNRLTKISESHTFRNARRALERIHEREDGPWMTHLVF